MDADPAEDVMALLPPLLGSLEALGFFARHFHPPAFGAVMGAIGSPDEALRAARPRLDVWPEVLAMQRACLADASDYAIAAFDALREAPERQDGLRAVFRALGQLPRAQEALYPLAPILPSVNRFFLDPAVRADPAHLERLASAAPREDVGVFHLGGEPGARGAFSLYAPEYYSPDRAWPLVVALHGGSGNGRNFLWSWLRDARTFGAILIAPTAVGDTWALMGEDADTPNLRAILEEVQSRWRIDPARRLLTGMSDGGTFTYVSGLEPASPFTHLAPVSAAFHPMLAQMADPERLKGLPIFMAHGALDWMFPIGVAREAQAALVAAGASVTYREIDDLSHTYPREINAEILTWLDGTLERAGNDPAVGRSTD
jgi:phospholipase/carboxylesterase